MSIVPTQEEIQTFKMPEVEVGTPVTFYANGLKEGTEPRIGFILRISRSGRNVVIRTAEGGHYESVRHIDDPKLQLNSDHRENGGWDFAEFHKQELKEREEIRARLAALEFSATKKTVRRKKASDSKTEETYSSLRERALGLGIEFKGNPKRQWLEQKVQEFESEASEATV